MKKTTIQEELKRFHEISGKQNISEGFIDDLLKATAIYMESIYQLTK